MTRLSGRCWHAVMIDEDGALDQRGGLPLRVADENHWNGVRKKLQHRDLEPISLVAVIAVASTIVHVSPFSTDGAVAVENTTAGERGKVLRSLLRWASSSSSRYPHCSGAS